MKLHYMWHSWIGNLSPRIELEIGAWWFSLYFDPRVWWLGYHYNADCCKFWLLLGFLEIERIYTD